MTGCYIVQVTRFSDGPRYARKLGGRFNPADKTWAIPQSTSADNHLRSPGIYGLKVLSRPDDGNHAVAEAERIIAGPSYESLLCPRCHTVCYGDCKSDR